MTRLSPSVLLTPDPEGMLFDEEEVNKRVKEAVLAEREACAKACETEYLTGWMTDSKLERAAYAKIIRSRNEESK